MYMAQCALLTSTQNCPLTLHKILVLNRHSRYYNTKALIQISRVARHVSTPPHRLGLSNNHAVITSVGPGGNSPEMVQSNRLHKNCCCWRMFLFDLQMSLW